MTVFFEKLYTLARQTLTEENLSLFCAYTGLAEGGQFAAPAPGQNLNRPYRTISWFRRQRPDPMAARTFRSSGTTEGIRSCVNFSEQGLRLYQMQSCFQFGSVIEEQFDLDPTQVAGVSLVPPCHEWPDSSLAQMIEWIGELVQVKWVTQESLEEELKSLGSSPAWIFGTGFHFVQRMDDYAPTPLNRNQIVIDTGGTKGLTRDISREDFRSNLRSFFQIKDSQIVSEYGMAELAAQAWAVGEEPFRFGSWVYPEVTTGVEAIGKKGTGTLIIHDPFRIDTDGPVKTEDLVELSDDKSFRLISRIEKAPLKGCSTKVTVEPLEPTLSSPEHSYPEVFPNGHSEALKELVETWIKSEEFSHAMEKENPHPSFAQAIGSHMRNQICESAWPVIEKNPGRNLLVSPNTHSLAGLFPLLLAIGNDLPLAVRTSGKQSVVLQSLLNRIAKKTNSIKHLDSGFRLNSRTIEHWDHVICFGSSETIQRLKDFGATKITGFGSRVGISVVESVSSVFDKILFDAFSLFQRGCRSTRLLVTNEPLDAIRKAVQEFTSTFNRYTGLDDRGMASLSYQKDIFLERGYTMENKYPLIVMKELESIDQLVVPEDITRTEMALPIISIRDSSTVDLVKYIARQFDNNQSELLLTLEPEVIPIVKRELQGTKALITEVGQTQFTAFQTTHESLSFFP